MPEEFSLGLTEVDVAVRRSGFPANWHPFEIRSAGRTLDEHARLSAAAWESLRARGLAGPDALDADVAQALRTWTRPEVLVVVRAAELAQERQVFYRAAIGHGLGVCSELAGDGITFVRVRPDRVVDTLIGLLPRYGPLSAPPVTVTLGAGRAPDRDALAEYARWPPHRHGTFELSARAGEAPLRPAGTATFADSDGGRYLTFTETLPHGESRIRFVPSDGTHLRAWLHERIAASTER